MGGVTKGGLTVGVGDEDLIYFILDEKGGGGKTGS